jgi:malonyl-CoA O-methyltransferase
LNPSAAVHELCRVVRPGGKITIIDKNVEHKGVLETMAWEKWFQTEEVENWLKQYCTDVSSEFITHGNKTIPDGLFVAWYGTRL